jgi:hypothetical protein
VGCGVHPESVIHDDASGLSAPAGIAIPIAPPQGGVKIPRPRPHQQEKCRNCRATASTGVPPVLAVAAGAVGGGPLRQFRTEECIACRRRGRGVCHRRLSAARRVAVTLRFSLVPTATRLTSGDRLLFQIASRTDLIRGAIEEGYIHFDLEVPPYFSKNTVHHGAGSYVEIDVRS